MYVNLVFWNCNSHMFGFKYVHVFQSSCGTIVVYVTYLQQQVTYLLETRQGL